LGTNNAFPVAACLSFFSLFYSTEINCMTFFQAPTTTFSYCFFMYRFVMPLLLLFAAVFATHFIRSGQSLLRLLLVTPFEF
jgi:hypothetical protein